VTVFFKIFAFSSVTWPVVAERGGVWFILLLLPHGEAEAERKSQGDCLTMTRRPALGEGEAIPKESLLGVLAQTKQLMLCGAPLTPAIVS
jgi:hypothetical protein